jgi:hypothetical protein
VPDASDTVPDASDTVSHGVPNTVFHSPAHVFL